MKSISHQYWGDDPRFFIGKIRRADDPKNMGRVQVRIIGIHDNYEILDHDLPWAQTLLPVTSPGISGDGENCNLARGAMVYGMFLDGKLSQIPLVLGSFTTLQLPSETQVSDPRADTLPVDAGGFRRNAKSFQPGQSTASVQQNSAEIEAAAQSITGDGTEEKIFNSLRVHMEPAQACAFLGNMRIESGFSQGRDYDDVFTVTKASSSHQYQSAFEGKKLFIKSGPWSEIVNPNDVGLPSFGLCQWRGKRWENLVEFSEGKYPWQSIPAQCDFVWHECTGTQAGNENSAWNYINACGADVANAAYHVCRYYERPSFKFVRYGTGEYGACPYTSAGSSSSAPGRRYWSPSLSKRIYWAKVYYVRFVQGNQTGAASGGGQNNNPNVGNTSSGTSAVPDVNSGGGPY